MRRRGGRAATAFPARRRGRDRGLGGALGLIAALGLALGCGSGADLPPPVLPLTATPDAPFRARPPELGPERPLAPPPVDRRVLGNGLELWVLPRPDWPRVSLRMAVRPASTATVDDAGLAAMLAQLVAATPSRRQRQAASTPAGPASQGNLDGTDIETRATRFGTIAAVEAIPQELPAAFAKLARAVQEPALSPDAVQDARVAQLYEIRSAGYSARAIALRLAQEAIFGAGHPYSVSPLGFRERIEAVGPEELTAYHRRRYVPGATAVIVVGDVAVDQVTTLAEAYLGPWPSAPVPEDRPPAVPLSALGGRVAEAPPVIVADVGAGGEPVLLLAQTAPAPESTDSLPFRVLAQVLGGAASSRLAERLREGSGTTYDAAARYEPLPHFGLLFAETHVEPREVGGALRAMAEEMRRLRDQPIQEEEVQAAVMGLRYGQRSRLATTPGAATCLAELFLQGLPPGHPAELDEALAAVSVPRVADVADRYLDPVGAQRVVAGFLSTYERSLADAGFHALDVFRQRRAGDPRD